MTSREEDGRDQMNFAGSSTSRGWLAACRAGPSRQRILPRTTSRLPFVPTVRHLTPARLELPSFLPSKVGPRQARFLHASHSYRAPSQPQPPEKKPPDKQPASIQLDRPTPPSDERPNEDRLAYHPQTRREHLAARQHLSQNTCPRCCWTARRWQSPQCSSPILFQAGRG